MSLIDFERGQCKRVTALLDSHLKGELTGEISEAVNRHLGTCRQCSQAFADRSRAKSLLQQAVMNDQAPPELRHRIRQELRKSSVSFRWTTWALAAAAAVALLAGALGVVRFITSPGKQAGAHRATTVQNANLLNIGLGDHVRCAIDHDMANRRLTPDAMAAGLGPEYADIVDRVRNRTSSEYEITVGHRCHVDGREFVHLILKTQSSAVSLIVTRKNGESFAGEGLAATLQEMGIPIYQNRLRGFEVAGFETRDHLVFVISTLPDRDNLQLASTLAPAVRDFLTKLEA